MRPGNVLNIWILAWVFDNKRSDRLNGESVYLRACARISIHRRRIAGGSTTRYRKSRNAARRPALAIKLLRETRYRVNDLVASCRALLITLPTTCP